MNNVIVIGPGRMGTAVTLALQAVGWNVLAAFSHRPQSAASVRFTQLTQLPVLGLGCLSDYLRAVKVVLIAVPDKAVSQTAQILADTGCIDADHVIAHMAGALSSAVLSPLENTGASLLSLHPLQTVADPVQGKDLLNGAYCTLEGHERGVSVGRQLVCAWGGKPVVIRPEQRPAYHAAAVLASNAVVALAAVASDASGLPDGLSALLPLLQGAVDNLRSAGLPDALTGPVDRADFTTVERHLEALQHNPTALLVYAALGRATADVACQKGSLSREQRDAFHSRFDSVMGGMSNE